MALKKSELYSSLWQSCDELRGGMDASQYKDYVLVLLFIKYVSDKYAGQPYAPITIPPGASFKDMVALKGTGLSEDHVVPSRPSALSAWTPEQIALGRRWVNAWKDGPVPRPPAARPARGTQGNAGDPGPTREAADRLGTITRPSEW